MEGVLLLYCSLPVREKQGFIFNDIPSLENLTSANCYSVETVSLTEYCAWLSSGSNNIT